MKIDPYCQRQKCRPMNLVSGNIRFMGIFAGVPLGGGVKYFDSGVVDDGKFRRFVWLASSETSEIKPAILHGDMLPLVCL